MSKKQKIVLWIGLVLFVLMAISPPWGQHIEGTWYSERYALILDPPFDGSIDWSRLSLQWVIVAALTAGVLLTMGNKPKKGN